MYQLKAELQTAAELGQHLLQKHDDYVRTIDKERTNFLAAIERETTYERLVDNLEANNRQLESDNARMMSENLNLMKRLRDLDNSLIATDGHNQDLRVSLRQAEADVNALSSRASKMQALEAHIMTLELEKEILESELEVTARNSVIDSTGHARAQKQIRELQVQLDSALASLQVSNDAEGDCSIETSKHDPTEKVSADNADPSKTLTRVVSELITNNAQLRRTTSSLTGELSNKEDEIDRLRLQLLSDARVHGEVDGKMRTKKKPRKTVSQELHSHHHYHYHSQRKSKPMSGVLKTPRLSAFGAEPLTPTSIDRRPETDKYDNIPAPRSGLQPASPPTSSRATDDSGYFSLSSGTMHKDSRYSCLSTFADLDDCEGSLSVLETPIRRKLTRSNTHESIFPSMSEARPCTADTLWNELDDDNRPQLQRSNSLESCHDASAYRTAHRPSYLVTQTSSTGRGGTTLLRKNVQQNASDATVSLSSESVHTVPGAPNISCNEMLRSTVRAQKPYKPARSATSYAFWKKTDQDHHRWGPFRWNSSPSITSGQAGQSQTLPVVHLSVMHQSLLDEALGCPEVS